MLSVVRLTPSFSKCCIEKRIKQSHVKFPRLLKTEYYVVEQTGLVIWLTIYFTSVHYFDTKLWKHFKF